jgi:hypothetical protein
MTGYGILVYLHVASAFAFVMVHGVSAFAGFRIKAEADAERQRALLNLSAGTYGAMYASLGMTILTGVALGFGGGHWGSGWIWLALIVLVITAGVMSVFAMREYTPLRRALGLPYFANNRQQNPETPAAPEVIAGRLQAVRPMPLAVVGIAGLAIILWLMLFKPF